MWTKPKRPLACGVPSELLECIVVFWALDLQNRKRMYNTPNPIQTENLGLNPGSCNTGGPNLSLLVLAFHMFAEPVRLQMLGFLSESTERSATE